MSHHFKIWIIIITIVLSCCPICRAAFPDDDSDMEAITSQGISPLTSLPQYMVETHLHAELNRYQRAALEPWPTIPGALLKPGRKNANVLLLRERLRQTGDLASILDKKSKYFDDDLEDALRSFQLRHGLKDDGVVGPVTANELNIPPAVRIQQIQMNMQRWAHLSNRLGNRYIMVNIPEFQLHLFDDGAEVLTMKTIVGKPDWPTPELSSKINRIIFNPFWNVPDKIAVNDVIPKAIDDPYYLDDMHIKVFLRGPKSREINHRDIDWARVGTHDLRYDFRQEPGDDNALGVIKFEFENTHNVYLHDTPAKSLFEQPLRALSHGCVRLENPMALVDYLMRDNPKWDLYRAQELIDTRKTSSQMLKKPIPIYITYFTVWVDSNGVVNYRNDVYNRDANGEL